MICKSVGKHFLNGISSSYDNAYPEELRGVVDEMEFVETVNRLNDTIISFWPCTSCYLFGYVCAPCTLGLSLCCPATCAGQAEVKAMAFVEQVSLRRKFYERQIVWTIRKKFFYSYLEISFPDSLRFKSIS